MLHLYLRLATEVPAHLYQRASFGVCGLLALPNIYKIFGDHPASYPCLVCVMERGFSPPEGRMWRVCYRWQHRSFSVADRTLGNSVGAIESVIHSVSTMCTLDVGDWGRLGGSLLGIFHPFGGCACALRRLGLGLLPG